MNNYKFKAGDKVYFPKVSHKIYTLKESSNNRGYPLSIEYDNGGFDDFTVYGHLNSIDANSSLILATEENRYLLTQLYKMEFEMPVTKQSVIDKNIKEKGYCLCLVSDDPIIKVEHLHELNEIMEVITKYDKELAYPYISSLNSAWSYAEPIQINLDGTITYLADI